VYGSAGWAFTAANSDELRADEREDDDTFKRHWKLPLDFAVLCSGSSSTGMR
jgi:hypothetical protein